jgi:hypothetical protein
MQNSERQRVFADKVAQESQRVISMATNDPVCGPRIDVLISALIVA